MLRYECFNSLHLMLNIALYQEESLPVSDNEMETNSFSLWLEWLKLEEKDLGVPTNTN